MIKVSTIQTDDIKTEFHEGNDVEYTKRGLVKVHIKKEYDGKSYEYDTGFSLNRVKTDDNQTGEMNGDFGTI